MNNRRIAIAKALFSICSGVSGNIFGNTRENLLYLACLVFDRSYNCKYFDYCNSHSCIKDIKRR